MQNCWIITRIDHPFFLAFSRFDFKNEQIWWTIHDLRSSSRWFLASVSQLLLKSSNLKWDSRFIMYNHQVYNLPCEPMHGVLILKDMNQSWHSDGIRKRLECCAKSQIVLTAEMMGKQAHKVSSTVNTICSVIPGNMLQQSPWFSVWGAAKINKSEACVTAF